MRNDLKHQCSIKDPRNLHKLEGFGEEFCGEGVKEKERYISVVSNTKTRLGSKERRERDKEFVTSDFWTT